MATGAGRIVLRCIFVSIELSKAKLVHHLKSRTRADVHVTDENQERCLEHAGVAVTQQ